MSWAAMKSSAIAYAKKRMNQGQAMTEQGEAVTLNPQTPEDYEQGQRMQVEAAGISAEGQAKANSVEQPDVKWREWEEWDEERGTLMARREEWNEELGAFELVLEDWVDDDPINTYIERSREAQQRHIFGEDFQYEELKRLEKQVDRLEKEGWQGERVIALRADAQEIRSRLEPEKQLIQEPPEPKQEL